MRPLLLTGLVLALAAPARADLQDRVVERVFPDAAHPDPLHTAYEELFGEPWPDYDDGPRPLRPMRPFEDVDAFDRAFDRATDGVRASVSESGPRLVLRVELPGSSGRPLEVAADRRWVRLLSRPAEAAGAWRVSRAREHWVPTPEKADFRSAEVRRDGDVVEITFAAR